MEKIFFICPYPLSIAPSQRFRFEQYFALLESNAYILIKKPLFSETELNTFKQSGSFLLKAWILVKAFFRRFFQLFQIAKVDFVFIHREAFPIGPPVLEWIVAKILRKKIIYDFDDAIWLTDRINESLIACRIRWRSKVASICKWSYRISAGNNYLCTYASQFNGNVIRNPTTIETDLVAGVKSRHDHDDNLRVIIAWTGSRTTLKYLLLLEGILQTIQEKYDYVDVLVIADEAPSLRLKRLIFKPWSHSTETTDLAHADIGIMPLPDNEWTRGKCGFKALQYMSLEIPPVVSPVGVNKDIIISGVSGYLCTTEKDWLNALEHLIENKALRHQMGSQAVKIVRDQFSVASNSSNFLSLFE